MNCSNSLCNFEAEFYCICSDTLNFLFSNHSAAHIRDKKSTHNIKNFSIYSYKVICFPF